MPVRALRQLLVTSDYRSGGHVEKQRMPVRALRHQVKDNRDGILVRSGKTKNARQGIETCFRSHL